MTEECASQDGNARKANASGEFRQIIYTAIASGGARTHRVGSQYPQDEVSSPVGVSNVRF